MICTIARVTVIAVNIEQTIPIMSVTAKPLIGPVPIANRMNATKNVVKFEVENSVIRSVITRHNGLFRRGPPLNFFSYSLTNQDVGIDRHTNGNYDTCNTRQGE